MQLADGRVLRAGRVLVTTGLKDQIPDIPGLEERRGRDLLHCPYCHGYEVRDQPLGVLGGSPDALVHAHIVRQWSSDVVYFTNGATLTASEREQLVARAIGIVDDPVARLVVEDDRLIGVELTSGAVVPRAAVFVRPTFVANDQLLTDLGCATAANGWVSVDATGATSVPACGPRATPPTLARRSSPQPVRALPRPSPSTTTSSPRTSPSPSRTSASASPPDPHKRHHAVARHSNLTEQEHLLSTTHTNPQHAAPAASPVGPPTKHQLALMIWVAVFPDFVILNLALGPLLEDLNVIVRTFVLATVAVPIVIYGLMPRLHRLRGRILNRRAA